METPPATEVRFEVNFAGATAMSMADAKKMIGRRSIADRSPGVGARKKRGTMVAGAMAASDLEAQLRQMEKDAKEGKSKDGFATIRTTKK